MSDLEIHGTCDDRFDIVRDAFAANFAAGLEIGAAVAVTVDGEMVVDLWAGDRNGAGDPWEQDTIVNVYSTTKTMAGICMLMLADRDLLDFSQPVAHYWPEFAAQGKEGVLVSHVMSHQAGLSGFEPAVVAADLYDHAAMAELLAAMDPWWEPGTGSGYHAITQGFLQAEILRRSHQTVGENTLPDAVDEHSAGERVVACDEPLRETEAVCLCLFRESTDRR